MHHLSLWLFLLFSLSGLNTVWGQRSKIEYRDRLGDSVILINTAEEKERIKRPKALRGELSGGFRLNSNGWGVFVDKGYLRGGEAFGQINRDKYFQVRLFQLELGEIKHPKEISSSFGLPGFNINTSAYILGKVNNVYQARLGYGYRRLIAGKPDPGTVSVHWVYMGGFAAALVKPYYLRIQGLGEVKYDVNNEAFFVSPGYILGKSGFSKGFDELEFIPGVFLKTGLHFDFATRRKGLIALEVGVNGTYYTQKIEQMVRQDPKQFFFNLYASLQFGKRW